MVNAVAERAPRAQIALSCTLRRRTGSPIPARTLVLGPRGMNVFSPRPLTLDETVGFELADLSMRVSGTARVLRQERLNVYALRFEGLPEPMIRTLHALAVNAPPQPPG
jgi:PilZ domain